MYYSHSICIVEHYIYVFKLMHIYVLALESAVSTVSMFWLRACIVPNLGCAINDVLFPAVFLTVPPLLRNLCMCSEKTSTLMRFLHCKPITDIFVDRWTQ